MASLVKDADPLVDLSFLTIFFAFFAEAIALKRVFLLSPEIFESLPSSACGEGAVTLSGAIPSADTDADTDADADVEAEACVDDEGCRGDAKIYHRTAFEIMFSPFVVRFSILLVLATFCLPFGSLFVAFSACVIRCAFVVDFGVRNN